MSSALTAHRASERANGSRSRERTMHSTAAVLSGSAALGALGYAARVRPYFQFDLPFTQALQSVNAAWFRRLMRVIGYPGYPPQVYSWVGLTLLFFWLRGERWKALSFLFATAGVSALALGVKLLVARPRPSPDLVRVNRPGLDGGGLSFPAGHSQVYTTVLGFLIYLIMETPRRTAPQIALLAVLDAMIALIGISRIYAGEHWLSDAVGGYLMGAIGLVLTIEFYEWGKPKFFVEDTH